MAEVNVNTNKIHTIPSASELFSASAISDSKLYWDRSHYGSIEAQQAALENSSTLYIGNLTFQTTSAQLYSLFGTIGRVKRIILGLDRNLYTPCGFAFCEYYVRKHAEMAILNLTGTKLDGRVIRVELDAGFHPGRQYGRGAKGGQVRDDRRNNAALDPARSRRGDPMSGSNSNQYSQRNKSHNNARPYPNFKPPSSSVGEKRGRDTHQSQNNYTNGAAYDNDATSDQHGEPAAKLPKLE